MPLNDRAHVVGSGPVAEGPDISALWPNRPLRYLPLDDVSDINKPQAWFALQSAAPQVRVAQANSPLAGAAGPL